MVAISRWNSTPRLPGETAVVQVSDDLQIWRSSPRFTGSAAAFPRLRCWSLGTSSPQFIRLQLGTDANGNNLLDTWEYANGLSIMPGWDESEQSFDANGLTNRVNFENGVKALSGVVLPPLPPLLFGLPDTPGILSAIRLDGQRVQLTFQPTQMVGNDTLTILRATDSYQWAVVHEQLTTDTWTDPNALHHPHQRQ